MFWMRLRKGNSSRRVRRYWALILHVKHFALPVHQLASSHESRDRSIAQPQAPQAVQIGRVSHRCDWSGPGCTLGVLYPDSWIQTTGIRSARTQESYVPCSFPHES